MYGSFQRYLMESSNWWVDKARMDGARAARNGEERKVPELYLDRASTWLIAYDSEKEHS